MTSNGKLINVCFNSSAQGHMVKTTQKSYRFWSAIFCEIVYRERSTLYCIQNAEFASHDGFEER